MIYYLTYKQISLKRFHAYCVYYDKKTIHSNIKLTNIENKNIFTIIYLGSN